MRGWWCRVLNFREPHRREQHAGLKHASQCAAMNQAMDHATIGIEFRVERLDREIKRRKIGMAEAYSPRSASQDAIASASGPVLSAKMCPSTLGGRGLGSST